MKDNRRKQIEALVARREAVTMEELRAEFGRSEERRVGKECT